jgi:hypothetical protein
VCNQASILGCTFPGEVQVGFDTAVLAYQPTWHAARIGFIGQIALTERLSFSAEIAGIPYASVQNKDSHLLRQSFVDLGPAPNVIANSRYALGGEAELMLNYAVTPNIEIGAGGRYWGLTARRGEVLFGPAFNSFNNNSSLNRFASSGMACCCKPRASSSLGPSRCIAGMCQPRCGDVSRRAT